MNKNDSLKTNFRQSHNFAPFHVQLRYLNKVSSSAINAIDSNTKNTSDTPCCINDNNSTTKIVAEQYAKACEGAECDEIKNLVMFQRFYHVYENHELDDLVNDVGGLVTCDSGYESGNYYVVVKKKE